MGGWTNPYELLSELLQGAYIGGDLTGVMKGLLGVWTMAHITRLGKS